MVRVTAESATGSRVIRLTRIPNSSSPAMRAWPSSPPLSRILAVVAQLPYRRRLRPARLGKRQLAGLEPDQLVVLVVQVGAQEGAEIAAARDGGQIVHPRQDAVPRQRLGDPEAEGRRADAAAGTGETHEVGDGLRRRARETPPLAAP